MIMYLFVPQKKRELECMNNGLSEVFDCTKITKRFKNAQQNKIQKCTTKQTTIALFLFFIDFLQYGKVQLKRPPFRLTKIGLN